MVIAIGDNTSCEMFLYELWLILVVILIISMYELICMGNIFNVMPLLTA